jgi:hypothetical protein
MTQALSVLVGLGIVGAVLYVLWRPHLAVIGILVLFPLEQLLQSYFPQFTQNSSLINIAVGLFTVFAVISRFMKGEIQAKGIGNLAAVMAWCIFIIAAIGTFWAPNREVAQEAIRSGFPYWILMLILGPLLLGSVRDYQAVLVPLMAVGAAIALLIIVNPRAQFIDGRFFLDTGQYGVKGGNPLALGNMGGMIALVAALYRPRQKSGLTTLVRAAAFITGLGLAIYSGSRGQVLAAGLVGLLCFPLSRQLNNPKQFFATVIGLGVLSIALFGVGSIFIGAENQERWDLHRMWIDIVERFDMNMSLVEAWLSGPEFLLLGLGPTAFPFVTGNTAVDYVHNIVTEILCEEGIVGFIMFCVMMWYTAKQAMVLLRTYRSDPPLRSVVAIVIGVFLFNFILALKQGTFLAHPAVMMWAVIMCRIGLVERDLHARNLQVEHGRDSWTAPLTRPSPVNPMPG